MKYKDKPLGVVFNKGKFIPYHPKEIKVYNRWFKLETVMQLKK